MALPQVINATAKYYTDLILYQYQSKPKAVATIDLLIRQALCDLVPLDVRDAFDIDTAVGVQLDVLGKYIGFSRRVLSQIPRDYFTFGDTDTPTLAVTGFTAYDSAANPTSVFLRYSMLAESFDDLEDEDYRLMLKIKIVLNSTDNTLKSITDILFEFFGTDLICYDSKDMTISYLVKPAAKKIALLFASQNALPKPQGVGLTGVYLSVDPTKIYGLADYTETISAVGFSDYSVGFTDTQWLRYEDQIA